MRHRLGLFWCTALVLGSSAICSSALADEAIAKYRHSVMEAVGGHTTALNAILKKQVPFVDDAQPHAQALASLAKMADRIFPADSKGGHALPAIWEKPDDFRKSLNAFQTTAAALAAASDDKAMAGAFADMVKTCKDCHDQFRKKD